MPRNCTICKKKGKFIFKVPQDEVRALKWQELCGQILVPGKSVLCEKHFLETDIITEKEIKDSSGHVICTVCIYLVYKN